MSLRSSFDIKIIQPIQALPVKWSYALKNKYAPINTDKRDYHIVVSLTSFPARFETLHYAIKSILAQSMKPDVIFLCLTKSEVHDEAELPTTVLELKKYGLEIFFANDNLKPHNKYLYAMRQYPNSLVVTIDDDNMYDKHLIHNLYNAHQKYPAAVCARRVHKIAKDKNNVVLQYNKWGYEYKNETEPSCSLLATGVGGVLYPPGLLPQEIFNTEKIRELCLNADDIWLKFMELKNNIPVVWVKGGRVHPLPLRKAQKLNLQNNNYHKNQNDIYIAGLQDYYGIDLVSFLR